MLIGPADDLEKQFGSGFGKGNISQFIDDQQVESLELFMESLKSFFLAAFHQLSDKIRSRMEANFSALGAVHQRNRSYGMPILYIRQAVGISLAV